jgi:hypothetical protein
VGKFLQWFLFDFPKSLFTFELFWLINFLRSISVSVFTILMPRALLVATSSSSNAGKAVPKYWSWNSSSPPPLRF